MTESGGEETPHFDPSHYPNGVNANFLTDDADHLKTTYAGGYSTQCPQATPVVAVPSR
jgi:hypothetical protein